MLFNQGSKFFGTGFFALYQVNRCNRGGKKDYRGRAGGNQGRVAFAAGKKMGGAPLRNRAKRRLREAARLTGAPWCGADVVFVAQKGLLKADFLTITKDMRQLETLLLREAQQDEDHKEHEENQFSNEKERVFHAKELVQGLANKDFAVPAGKNQSGLLSLVVGIPRNIALLCIKAYRHAISPLFPPSCRYVPTCSEYAMIAFKRFGFWKGLWLSVKRVGRCHPFVKGGYDPVPDASEKKLA